MESKLYMKLYKTRLREMHKFKIHRVKLEYKKNTEKRKIKCGGRFRVKKIEMEVERIKDDFEVLPRVSGAVGAKCLL